MGESEREGVEGTHLTVETCVFTNSKYDKKQL